MYTGFVVHDRGDFLGWACSLKCAESLVDSATTVLNPGDIGIVVRGCTIEHTCFSCEMPTHSQ